MAPEGRRECRWRCARRDRRWPGGDCRSPPPPRPAPRPRPGRQPSPRPCARRAPRRPPAPGGGWRARPPRLAPGPAPPACLPRPPPGRLPATRPRATPLCCITTSSSSFSSPAARWPRGWSSPCSRPAAGRASHQRRSHLTPNAASRHWAPAWPALPGGCGAPPLSPPLSSHPTLLSPPPPPPTP